MVRVRYRISDATSDVDREVWGDIEITVRSSPEQPSPPQVVEGGNGYVKLAWQPPFHNGAPITGYRVTSSPPSDGCASDTTSCTVSGLDNDTEYRFQVTAENDVGGSDS